MAVQSQKPLWNWYLRLTKITVMLMLVKELLNAPLKILGYSMMVSLFTPTATRQHRMNYKLRFWPQKYSSLKRHTSSSRNSRTPVYKAYISLVCEFFSSSKLKENCMLWLRFLTLCEGVHFSYLKGLKRCGKVSRHSV